MMVHLRPPQWTVFNSKERFRVLVAGRRFGKTYLAAVELVRAAWAPGRKVVYVAPNCKQAKRILWRLLKQMTREYWAGKPNETELTIELQAGGSIAVRGADDYDALRGEGFDFIVLDEYASMAREAWTEVLRPALADRKGGALFIGTPKGFNHFHDLWKDAQQKPDWAAFRYTTAEGGNVSAEELASAARELDERVYQQEFCGNFQNLTSGRVYYAFDVCDIQDVKYDRRYPLCWTLDFNIDPACSLICQMIAPDGKIDPARQQTLGIQGPRLNALNEIALRNSNTYEVCRAFEQLMQPLLDKLEDGARLRVQVYGDATGERRQSAASRTDWQIVKEFFARRSSDFDVTFHVPSGNPEIKDRINSVNALISNAQRQRRLSVSPRCKLLIRDLEQVTRKLDAHGNATGSLDNSDPMRTHASDALGYLITREFRMGPKDGLRPGIIC